MEAKIGKSSFLSNAVLNVIFNGTGTVGLFQNDTSAPITEIWAALHTADPTASGNQTSNEISYPGYARVAVARNTVAFPLTTDETIALAANINFPACTGGSTTATFLSFGMAQTGGGNILYSGALDDPILCVTGVEPVILDSTTVAED